MAISRGRLRPFPSTSTDIVRFNGAEGALNGVIASNPISHVRVLADSTRNTVQPI